MPLRFSFMAFEVTQQITVFAAHPDDMSHITDFHIIERIHMEELPCNVHSCGQAGRLEGRKEGQGSVSFQCCWQGERREMKGSEGKEKKVR